MGRRGGPRPGVRFPMLGLAVPALLCATAGCAGAGGSAPAPPPASASPPPASATSDAALCARLITYWAHEVLDDDTYGDYQSMGLSHGQYQILRDVVDDARTVLRRQGREEANELIGRQAGQACTERYRNGKPSGGPWS